MANGFGEMIQTLILLRLRMVIGCLDFVLELIGKSGDSSAID